MNCSAFERWLDEGMPPGAAEADEARRHAGACVACAAALEAVVVLDRLLEGPPAAAPVGLTDHVMARIDKQRPARAGGALAFPEPDLPWWIRAIVDPACVFALLLAGILTWGAGALLGYGQAAVAGLGSILISAGLSLAARETLLLGLALGALPGVVWIAYLAFRWTERLAWPAIPGTPRNPGP